MAIDVGEDRPPSPPPLLAYTTSSLQSAGKKGTRGAKGGGSRQRSSRGGSTASTTKRFRKTSEPVLFDESARRDFLTGFRKRKQARIETSRKKALDREKEERRKARADARQARKDQAAENVRMEKIAYGDGLNEGDDSAGDDDDDEVRELSPSAYETEEHHTTVMVQEWHPDDAEDGLPVASTSDAPPPRPAKPLSNGQKKAQSINASLPPSSRRMAKKLKNAASASTSSKKRKTDARDISKLLDLDDVPIALPVPTTDQNGNRTSAASASTVLPSKKKTPKFHYESKLERAKAKAKIREDRAKFAERRKEERLLAARGGKPKGHRGTGARRKK